MNLSAWIFFGILISFISHVIDPGPDKEKLRITLFVGLMGALTGGFLGNFFFNSGSGGFNFPAFSIAVLTSLLLLFILRSVQKT